VRLVLRYAMPGLVSRNQCGPAFGRHKIPVDDLPYKNSKKHDNKDVGANWFIMMRNYYRKYEAEPENKVLPLHGRLHFVASDVAGPTSVAAITITTKTILVRIDLVSAA
jgi:hypothetical protein